MKQNNLPLNEIGDKTVFKVPENYFENFKAELGKRIDALELEDKNNEEKIQIKTGGKFILTMEMVKPYLYMAAMFVLLLFSISFIYNLSSKSSSSLGLAVESTSTSTTPVPTAEDYLINSVGTYGITEYYVNTRDIE